MAAKFVHEGKSIDYTPISAAVDAGRIVQVSDHLIGIALRRIEKGQLGALQIEGVFDLPTVDTELTLGGLCYIDIASQMATSDNNDIFFGVVVGFPSPGIVRAKLLPII